MLDYHIIISIQLIIFLPLLNIYTDSIFASRRGKNLTYLIQLICTVTPASSNMEETHNTLKFASRAKRVEIYASCNRVQICW